jgi:hypothetical protein
MSEKRKGMRQVDIENPFASSTSDESDLYFRIPLDSRADGIVFGIVPVRISFSMPTPQ